MSKQRRVELWPTEVEMSVYDWRKDPNMTEPKRLFYDNFVREYVKDFNATNAAVRCGCQSKRPVQAGSELIRKPYVAQRLDELVRKLTPQDVVTRQQVMARMWEEANKDGNACSSRVAALAHLAKMLNMFPKVEHEPNANQPAGVMMVPVMTMEDWQQSAMTAQALLKRTAGTPTLTCPPPQPVHGAS